MPNNEMLLTDEQQVERLIILSNYIAELELRRKVEVKDGS